MVSQLISNVLHRYHVAMWNCRAVTGLRGEGRGSLVLLHWNRWRPGFECCRGLYNLYHVLENTEQKLFDL